MDRTKDYLDDMAALEAKLQAPIVELEQAVRNHVWRKYNDQRQERADELIRSCLRRKEVLADSPFVSDFKSPLREIDEQMHEAFDLTLKQFGSAHGYEFWRAMSGSFNCPHRKLHRYSPSTRFRYSIGVFVSADMLQRLERDWYPEIPLDVMVFAASRVFEEGHYHKKQLLISGCPFVELTADKLRKALSQGLTKHTAWTEQYLLDHGEFHPRRIGGESPAQRDLRARRSLCGKAMPRSCPQE